MPPIDDRLYSLRRYYLWSNGSRARLVTKLVEGNTWGVPAENVLDTVAGQEVFEHFAHWAASLNVVVEGWHKLDLHDQAVDDLLTDTAKVALLQRFRNGVFHYRPSIFDSRFTELMTDPMVMPWLFALTDALAPALGFQPPSPPSPAATT